MRKFQVGTTYSSRDFLGHTCSYSVVKRTPKTVTLHDSLYKTDFVKRVKNNSSGEYVVFSEEFMGYAEMSVYA